MGVVGLGLTTETIKELPLAAQGVIAGMIVLLIASYEIHRSQVYSAHAEALAKFNQGIPLSELPQKFGLKLMTNVCASPAEFAEALVDEMVRPQWELNLKMVSKKAQ